jgi:WD40 repeat protein
MMQARMAGRLLETVSDVVVVGGGGGTLRVFDSEGQELGAMSGHKHVVEAVACCGAYQKQQQVQSCEIIASGGRDHDVIIWNLSTFQR